MYLVEVVEELSKLVPYYGYANVVISFSAHPDDEFDVSDICVGASGYPIIKVRGAINTSELRGEIKHAITTQMETFIDELADSLYFRLYENY
jgi:hypothetical protein